MHCIIHELEGMDNRFCFNAYCKPVTLHLWVVFSLSTLSFKRNFLCESSDDFLFVYANADWYMIKWYMFKKISKTILIFNGG